MKQVFVTPTPINPEEEEKSLNNIIFEINSNINKGTSLKHRNSKAGGRGSVAPFSADQSINNYTSSCPKDVDDDFNFSY